MADAYEREAMAGVGEVLHRQKDTSPKWAMWLATLVPAVPLAGLGISLVLGGQVVAGLGAIAAAAAVGAGMGFLMLTFASARIAVSEGELHLQLGMAGPRVPIGDIASVSIAPSGTNAIGMGVGNDLRGTTTYRLWGDNARAVHVEKTDGKKLVIVSKEPDALLAALDEAMARHGRAAPKVRVGEVEPVEDDVVAATAARARERR